jgi:hypothetical protein
MPTALGVIFLLLAVYCFTRGRDCLFSLLVFSGIFQASTVISGISVQPYYSVAVFFVVRCAADFLAGNLSIVRVKGVAPLMAFGALGILSAFLFPRIFSGTPVYDPTLGLDVGFFLRPGLEFSGANKYQACLLFVNILVVLCAALLPGEIARPSRSFRLGFLALLGIALTQWMFLFAGLSFPYAFFNNDKNYTLANADLSIGLARPNGTFSEPSMAGTILVAIFLGSLATYFKEGRGLGTLVLSIAGVLIVASGASFPAIALGSVLVLLSYPVIRFPYYLKLSRLRRSATLLGAAALGPLALVIPSLRSTLMQQLLNKQSSISFVSRTAADLYAFQLLVKTHGVGVGLGSNRPSSLLATIASNMGIAGIALFVIMIVRLSQNEAGEYYWLKWSVLGLILDMAFGVPDLNFPLLWILLALAARAARAERKLQTVQFQLAAG